VLFRGKRLTIGIGDDIKVLLANETPARDDTGIAVKSCR
jgi:hypothetical protein